MAANITVTVQLNRLPEITEQIRSRMAEAVERTCLGIETDMKLSMAEPKSGRTYKRGKAGTHTASAPGEAPAIDYGELVNSIGHKMTGAMEGEVTVGAEYAEALEFGTSKMAPRPFALPAVEKARRPFAARVRRAVAGT